MAARQSMAAQLPFVRNRLDPKLLQEGSNDRPGQMVVNYSGVKTEWARHYAIRGRDGSGGMSGTASTPCKALLMLVFLLCFQPGDRRPEGVHLAFTDLGCDFGEMMAFALAGAHMDSAFGTECQIAPMHVSSCNHMGGRFIRLPGFRAS
jgi:hypothetical protein